MKTLEQWHALIAAKDANALDAILAEDVTFHSPVVHTPQRGKAITKAYLTAAMAVLANSSFRYVREVADERMAVLEFVSEIDGTHINGVDMLAWNEAGKIVDIKVMVRPLRAINLLHQLMGAQLASG